MATIDSKQIIDELISGDGFLADLSEEERQYEPRAVCITEYTNVYDGRQAWGVEFENERGGRYVESPYIRNPKVIWEYKPADEQPVEPATFDELSEDRAATIIRPYGFENDWTMQAGMLEVVETPLNARDVVISRMKGMDEEQLERVITAAGILYWETGEGTTMLQCLFAAMEYERGWQG